MGNLFASTPATPFLPKTTPFGLLQWQRRMLGTTAVLSQTPLVRWKVTSLCPPYIVSNFFFLCLYLWKSLTGVGIDIISTRCHLVFYIIVAQPCHLSIVLLGNMSTYTTLLFKDWVDSNHWVISCAVEFSIPRIQYHKEEMIGTQEWDVLPTISTLNLSQRLRNDSLVSERKVQEESALSNLKCFPKKIINCSHCWHWTSCTNKMYWTLQFVSCHHHNLKQGPSFSLFYSFSSHWGAYL